MGELKGFDQTCTLILKKAVERIIQKNDATEEIPLGLYIVRGPDVALVGEMDAEREDAIDWEQVHADAMLKHHLYSSTMNNAALPVRPPSQIDRRATADVQRRPTSYNQDTLRLQQKEKEKRRDRNSVVLDTDLGDLAFPTLPPIPTAKPSFTATTRIEDILSKEVLEKAAAYESMSDARLSFDIFKNGLLEEIDRKLYASHTKSTKGRFSHGFTMRPNRKVLLETESEEFASRSYRSDRAAEKAARRVKKAAQKAVAMASQARREMPRENDVVSSQGNIARQDDLPRPNSNSPRNSKTNRKSEKALSVRSEADDSHGEPGIGQNAEVEEIPSAVQTNAESKVENDEEFSDEDNTNSDYSDENIDYFDEEMDIDEICEKALQEEENGLPAILLDLELETEAIQQELVRQREASERSAVTNAEFLEDGLTELVDFQRDQKMSTIIANQRLSLTVQDTHMIIEESERLHQKTDLILAAALGGEMNSEVDGYFHLDEVVMRTMNVDIPHYAFHGELRNLTQLRNRQTRLETAFFEEEISLRAAKSSLQFVDDELELLTTSIQKAEKVIFESLGEVTNLTSLITQRTILPTNLLQQIQNLITLILGYVDKATDNQESANTYRPSTAIQQARTASSIVLSQFKLMAPNLGTVAKQPPVFSQSSLRFSVNNAMHESSVSMMSAIAGVGKGASRLTDRSGVLSRKPLGDDLRPPSSKMLRPSGLLFPSNAQASNESKQ
ncbi:hypothetical protein CcCBS67573_g01911 [Chytriomyces confervae]|uniref:Sm domain-containing protein n=1 Tax=Chytriomyces confervae TaxID=246404 RepID=A0A507FMJ1_9FUNG|nr:hypothetical protein CcCBS67573_g01911 [Chytriomyces confervae]